MCVIFAANSVIIFMLVFSHNLLQVAAVLAFDGLSMGILDAGQVLDLVFRKSRKVSKPEKKLEMLQLCEFGSGTKMKR